MYLAAGASHVIVTSWVFRDGVIDFDRLRALGRYTMDTSPPSSLTFPS